MTLTDLDDNVARDARRKAKSLVSNYTLLLKPEGSGYVGTAIEFPTAWGTGDTASECTKDTQQSLEDAVATMIQDGQKPPSPGKSPTRDVQVNVKFSPVEETMLSSLASDNGFRGTGGLLRHLALKALDDSKSFRTVSKIIKKQAGRPRKSRR